MTPFKERMNLYRAYRELNPDKNYWDWKASVAEQDNDWSYQEWKRNLPENLRYESPDYDLYGAYKAGMQPTLESDGTYHLGSRDPQTGRLLKRKGHPTYQMTIDAEKAAGYDVYEGDDGEMYSKAPLPNEDISGWLEFKDYYNSNELGAKERQQLRSWYRRRKAYAERTGNAELLEQLKDDGKTMRMLFGADDKMDSKLGPYYFNVNLDNIPINVVDLSVLGKNIGGIYHVRHSSNPKGSIDIPNNYRSTDLLHEYTHALNSEHGEPYDKTKTILTDRDLLQVYPIGDDSYWLDPREVHSRLMELRHTHGISPLQKVTKDDLKKMRESGKSQHAILDYFADDDLILDLLNRVAHAGEVQPPTNSEKTDVLATQFGGVVPAMLDGGNTEDYVGQLIDLYALQEAINQTGRDLYVADHTDPNTGVVSPFYNKNIDAYGTYLLPELSIRPKYKSAQLMERALNAAAANRGRLYYHAAMHEIDAGRKVFNAAQWIPIVGAVGGVTEIGLDLARGNWQGAAINAALELLPESVERGIKARRIATAIDNAALNDNLRMPYTERRIGVDVMDEPTVQNFVDMQMWLDSAPEREMREFLKTRFNKWTKRYGYEPVPLDLSVNDAKEEMKKRILQHNTFVRGVRDPMVEIDHPGAHISSERAKANALILDELASRHGFPEGEQGRLLAAASTYAGHTGHGRYGVRNDKEHGALYTSNSLDTASDYASINGDPVGEVFSVQRPVDFSGDYREWLLHGDFPLRKSETGSPIQDRYVLEDLPYLLNTGRSLNQDVLKEVPITFEDYAERFNFNVTGAYSSVAAVNSYYDSLLQQVDEWFDLTNPGETRFYKRSLGEMQNKLLSEKQLLRLNALRSLHDYLKYSIRGGVVPLKADLAKLYFRLLNSPYGGIRLRIQKAKKRSSYHNYGKDDYLAREARSRLLEDAGINVNDAIEYWDKQPTIFTTEHRRKPTRKSDDAYNHYIILGKAGDVAVDNVNMLDAADWWGLGSGTRAHVGKSSQGFSRKFKYGGIVPAMQNGGETTDLFIAQFGDAVTYGKDDTNLIGDIGNWWNDLTGMKNYGYGYCAITPNGKLTTQCAKYSNDILRDQGYKNITGDAWNRAAYSNMKPITSGYTGLKKPNKYTKSAAHNYLQNAANNFAENVDTAKLITNDVIGIYYPDSPNTQKAFEGGQWGETQTHTGHTIVGKDGTHYVVHNVDGHLKINKLADMLTGKYDYLPVSAYRPRK